MFPSLPRGPASNGPGRRLATGRQRLSGFGSLAYAALAVLSAACDPGGAPALAAADAGPPAARTEGSGPAKPRTAFDLLSNRIHGVEYHDGRLVIRAGGDHWLKFVDGGWKTSWRPREKDEGRPVGLVGGLASVIFVPLDGEADGTASSPTGDRVVTISLRSLSADQRLSLFVNEQPAGTVEVPSTFGDVSFPVAGKFWRAGENRLRLQFRSAAPLRGGGRSAAAVAQLTVGPPGARTPIPPKAATEVTDVSLAGTTRRGFQLGGTGRLSFFVQVPAGGKLALGYGSPAEGASVMVRVSRDGAPSRVLHEGPAATKFTDATWDLGPEAGRAVRIDLVGRGGATAFVEPRLLVEAPVPGPLAEKHFDHIFIWMVDTLRADKVRAFNPKSRVETPHYDAFAADAVRFQWAQVPGTWSLPSHSSILTGVYPVVHQAIAHTARLSPEVPFIAEIMKKGGYRTGLFSSNGYVSGKWGFDRGWDHSRNFIRESLPNGADYLWKTARTWLDGPAVKGKPKFLYLATVEPHVIYNPKKEFLARYWKKPYTGPIKPNQSGVQLGYIKSGRLKIDANDKAYLEALYDGEVTQSDAMFGAFIADLKARKVYDRSVIVVISDHGDEFWEHGDVGHAQGVYQELVHIPLIVRAPGVFPAGKVVNADVEAMDVFPTLLDLAGLPTPAGTQGASLVPLVQDELSHSPRVSLTQNLAINRGIKSARYRMIHGGPTRLELYDEIDDPLEQKNLATSHPIALRQMRNVFSLLVAHEARWKKRAHGTAANVSEAFYSEIGDR